MVADSQSPASKTSNAAPQVAQGSTSSQQLIQKLLKAETDAEALIAAAKDRRTRKLREARQAADDDAAIFRKREEEKIAAEKQRIDHDSSSGTLDTQLQADLATLADQRTKNSKKVASYIVDRLTTVVPDLTEIQIASLKSK